MFNFLKWVGIAALVSVPIILIVNMLQSDEEDIAIEDEFDIYAQE
jgi:hypothetical protein